MSISSGLILLHELPAPPPLPGASGYRVVHAVGRKLLDELALISARLFAVPICLVLVDADYDWARVAATTEPLQPPCPGSLCAAAIAQGMVLRLEAVGQHPSGLVEAAVAHQLGLAPLLQPLLTRRGHIIGMMCLVATTSPSLDDEQRQVLAQLAALAALLIELRASAAEAQAVASFWQQAARELTTGLRHLLIAANQLRQAATGADRAAAGQHVQQTLAALQQCLA